MSEITHTADVPSTAWPKAVVAFGLGLTAAWMGFLGYALVKLIEIAI